MSGFFYSQSGNVGLGEDTESLRGILAEEERKRQEALAKKGKKESVLETTFGYSSQCGHKLWGGFWCRKRLAWERGSAKCFTS